MTPPPPCSGIQILQTLRVLSGYDVGRWDAFSEDYLHTLVEAVKLCRHDRVFEGSTSTRASEAAYFLSDEHIAELRAKIDPARAAASEGDWYSSPHTTHLSVGDRDGNLVSSTQTLGAIFGSGVVVDGTGVILNGLLFLFDSDPASPNRMEPGKKIDDPMSPVIARHPSGRAVAIGSPGGQGILQTNVQMFANIVHFGMSPQAAVESPRITSWGRRCFIDKFGGDHDPRSLAIEDRLPGGHKGRTRAARARPRARSGTGRTPSAPVRSCNATRTACSRAGPTRDATGSHTRSERSRRKGGRRSAHESEVIRREQVSGIHRRSALATWCSSPAKWHGMRRVKSSEVATRGDRPNRHFRICARRSRRPVRAWTRWRSSRSSRPRATIWPSSARFVTGVRPRGPLPRKHLHRGEWPRDRRASRGDRGGRWCLGKPTARDEPDVVRCLGRRLRDRQGSRPSRSRT